MQFERIVWRDRAVPDHGFPEVSDDIWIDSMHLAAAANLPRSLEGCAKAVGAAVQKDADGHKLMLRVTNGVRTPWLPDEQDLIRLGQYCIIDVQTEEATAARLPGWPDMQPWLAMPAIDRRINDRGVLIDVPLVQGMARAAAMETTRLDGDMARLTNGQVDRTSTVDQLKKWLVTCGVDVPRKDGKKQDDDEQLDLGDESDDGPESVTEKGSPYRLRKNDIANLLAGDLPDDCRSALYMRIEAAKASARKLTKMLTVADGQGIVRNAFTLMGAQATGRFAHPGPQFGNLIRDAFAKDYESIAEKNGLDAKRDKSAVRKLAAGMLATAIEVGRTGDPDLIRTMYEAPRKDLQGRVRIEGVLPWISRMSRRTIAAPKGQVFVNGDFSNIQARIPVWLAGQQETVDAFARGEDVYRQQASPIYGIAAEMLSAEQRQIGKVCIAEGSLVLTDQGLVEIQKITSCMKLWDGVEWVSHDGPVFMGWKETIDYEGLSATPDHHVWVQGEKRSIPFAQAAADRKHLVTTGIAERAIRMGDNNQTRSKKTSWKWWPLCCNKMYWLRQRTMDKFIYVADRQKQRLSRLFKTAKDNFRFNSQMFTTSQTKMYKSERQSVSQLRWQRNRISLQLFGRSAHICNEKSRSATCWNGLGSKRKQWSLRTGKSAMVVAFRQHYKPKKYEILNISESSNTADPCVPRDSISETELYIRGQYDTQTVGRLRFDRRFIEQNRQSAKFSQTKRPVWDILNAGPRNRFTVSGHLVANCRLFLGFGAGVNAFIPAAMIYGISIPSEMGTQIVNTFRETNKALVAFWDANLACAVAAVQNPGQQFFVPPTGIISWFTYGDCLCCMLPSTRLLRYWRPRLSQGYWENGTPKRTLDLTVDFVKGPFVFRRNLWRGLAMQNITCALEADLLCGALVNMDRMDLPVRIHVHDSASATVDEDRGEAVLPRFKEAMLDQPAYYAGLPIAADVDISARFG